MDDDIFDMTQTQSVGVKLIDLLSGQEIEYVIDPVGTWKRVLPGQRPDDLVLLARVDPYDDTHFKHTELHELARELAVLRSTSQGEDADFLDRLLELVARAKTAARFRIVFVGD